MHPSNDPVKLLIVDDEKVIRSSLEMMLKPLRFQTQTANDGLHALEIMDRETFHIVLTDINMPRMDGVELLKNIKSINPLTQVIIMTGYSSTSKVVDCLGSGAVDYFLKPFTDFTAFQKALADAKERAIRWHQVMRDTFRRGDINGDG